MRARVNERKKLCNDSKLHGVESGQRLTPRYGRNRNGKMGTGMITEKVGNTHGAIPKKRRGQQMISRDNHVNFLNKPLSA